MKIKQSEFLNAIAAAAGRAKPATPAARNRAARRAGKTKGVDERKTRILALFERLGLSPNEAERLLAPSPELPASEPKCRGCGVTLTRENDSAAHVIPNALGGRLKPPGILCKRCNGELGELADKALTKAFGPWPTLLNLPRDRKASPDVVMERRDGRTAWVRADGTISMRSVTYEVREIPEGHAVTIGGGDMTVVRNLLKRAAKRFPQMDLADAEKCAEIAKAAAERRVQEGVVEDGDHLKATLDYHPRAVFGGVVTAIWIFLLDRLGGAPMDWTGLTAFISRAQTNGAPFRHLVDGLPGLVGPRIDLGHKIVVRSIPRTGELVAYVEILGALKVGGVIAKAPAPSDAIELVYAYDLEAGKDRSAEFSIDAGAFERVDWTTVGLGPCDVDALRDHFAGILKHLEAVYHRRSAAP
ncbi:HNH endonuclease [Methylosinus sp. Ce-a6]|uniref:HNH endonuclease n=1 Tax=Methylosinus sp. Ce-a6 TaxID=2172005 RepID=UPI001358CAD2|nr:HNH endonuclease [Methylosinus sp. Ce-a6]